MKLMTRLAVLAGFIVLMYVLPGKYLLFTERPVDHRTVANTTLQRGAEEIRIPENEIAQDIPHDRNTKEDTNDIINVAVVVCGEDRVYETLVMLKSAVLFAPPHPLRIVVVTETHLMDSFSEKLSEWRTTVNNSFSFELREVKFPSVGGREWRKLFKPCASQRLFLPSLLSDYDSVLYVDTDVMFVAPLSTVWSHFRKMNSSQLAALSPEHEDPNTGWYNRFSKHPYYGKLGVNSGVMLMNLTRMREFRWESYLLPILNEFKLKITWGDQDIINIIFHFHPERLYVYDCRHNYRSDHCMYTSVCKEAEHHGARVIHGSRGTFHSDRQPAFRALYTALQQYELGRDAHSGLVLALESLLEDYTDTNCGKIASRIFLPEMKNYIVPPPPDGYR